MNTELVTPVIVNELIVSGSMPVFVTCTVVVVVLLTGRRPKFTAVSGPMVGGVAAVPVTFATTIRPVEVTTVIVAALTPDECPSG